MGDDDHVPLWTFELHGAGRDGLNRVGAMVDTNTSWVKQAS